MRDFNHLCAVVHQTLIIEGLLYIFLTKYIFSFAIYFQQWFLSYLEGLLNFSLSYLEELQHIVQIQHITEDIIQIYHILLVYKYTYTMETTSCQILLEIAQLNGQFRLAQNSGRLGLKIKNTTRRNFGPIHPTKNTKNFNRLGLTRLDQAVFYYINYSWAEIQLSFLQS